MSKRIALAAPVAAWLTVTTQVLAVPITYTDSVSFFTDLTSAGLTPSTLNFDGAGTPAGTLIPDGSTLGGITFNYNFGDVSMAVTDGNQFGGGGPFATTSGTNFLGTDDGDLFLDGDDFSLSFASSNAIGMFFITADTLFDNDIQLTAGGESAGLVALDIEQTLPDESDVYFLGIIDDLNTFTTASVTTIGGEFFLYNVDDITTATVPEPSTAALLGIALAGWTGLGVWRRRWARSIVWDIPLRRRAVTALLDRSAPWEEG